MVIFTSFSEPFYLTLINYCQYVYHFMFVWKLRNTSEEIVQVTPLAADKHRIGLCESDSVQSTIFKERYRGRRHLSVGEKQKRKNTRLIHRFYGELLLLSTVFDCFITSILESLYLVLYLGHLTAPFDLLWNRLLEYISEFPFIMIRTSEHPNDLKNLVFITYNLVG
ncbi:hypothetical protein EDC96DRAFT_540134 [Choanephora cucurbitarum]|nr:hypothetical protein EDC96DRAFT_540134 [Choanephora cucurbitarum]